MAIPTANPTSEGGFPTALLTWRQFSVYSAGSQGRHFSLACLDTFLPDFIGINRDLIKQWHFLFEPSVVVRYVSDTPDQVYECAQNIAGGYQLTIVPGDIELSSPNAQNNFIWLGEASIYGEDRWQALLKYLQGCSELSLETNKLDAKGPYGDALQKALHLTCNIFGCGYAEESIACNIRSDNAQKRYKSEGRT